MNKINLLVQISLTFIILLNPNMKVGKLKNKTNYGLSYQYFKNKSYTLSRHTFIKPIKNIKINYQKKKKMNLTNEICILNCSEKLIDYKLAFELQNILHHSKIIMKNINEVKTSNHLDLKKIKNFKENMEKYDFCFILQHTPCYTLGSVANCSDILLDKENYYIEELGDVYNNLDSNEIIQLINRCETIQDKINQSHIYNENTNYFNNFLKNCRQRKIPIYRVNRGGKATFHGPGQLVLYFIFNLKNYPANYNERIINKHYKYTNKESFPSKTSEYEKYNLYINPNSKENTSYIERTFDLHTTINNFQKIGMETLQNFNIKTECKKDTIGIFYKDKKIISIGLKIRKYISMHGLSLNFNLDNNFLKYLLSCGMTHNNYISMHEINEIKKKNYNYQKGEIASSSNILNKLTFNITESLKKVFKVKVRNIKDIREMFN
ncbi:lipoate-protein ligase B [Plasmodium sp. gorilla clade G2]|uniref:lipoate-protein ligase B n=1 Tax=Plasmodium sp. gorilla clade G2 TaxID=880535 RepID=UPI000D204B04|nr:lipoate-protein ligase B [Plasmodium sp. gorilla clade G2]SOV13783.1 lipoate-protein ligase B [Plasmodium sp. gorilla clade G2]